MTESDEQAQTPVDRDVDGLNLPTRFLSRSLVCEWTSLSATTLWREVTAGRFPKPVRVSSGRVAWPEHEVSKWMRLRMKRR